MIQYICFNLTTPNNLLEQLPKANKDKIQLTESHWLNKLFKLEITASG